MKDMLIFASPSAKVSGEGVFASVSAKSAVEAAAGASIAGARALALVGADEAPGASEAVRAFALAGVCGGALIGAVGGGIPELPTVEDGGARLALLAEMSEALDMPLGVVLPEGFRVDAPIAGGEGQRCRKQPEKYVLTPDNAAALSRTLPERMKKAAAALSEAGFDVQPPSDASPACRADAPVREMCAGCPYRGAFYVVSKLWLRAASDAGCTRLGARAPLLALDAAMNAGSALPVLRGMLLALGERERANTVGVTDVAGLRRGGLDGLRELAADKKTAAVIVLDNSPGGADIEKELAAAGATEVTVPDPADVSSLENGLRAALSGDGVGVVVCRGTCARKTEPAEIKYTINADRCRGCGACTRLGCPAIDSGAGRRPRIDPAKCAGCSLCMNVCKCGAVRRM